MADPYAQFADAPSSPAADPYAQFADHPGDKPNITTPAPLSGFDNFLRQTALTGRAAAEGVVNTFALPQTIQNWEMNKLAQGSNAVFGTKFHTDTPSVAEDFSNLMTDAGAYTPQTKGEQFSSAVTRGVTGALTGYGAIGALGGDASTVPNTIRAGASGLTGSAASEGARQAGAPPWLQFTAGLAGGQVPAFLESTGNTVRDLMSPLTSSGQARLAGNVLSEQAQDPNAAIRNLQNSQPLVPGSMPTSGPASQDLGLLGVEKAMRGRSPVSFAERMSQQNAARQSELTDLAGTPNDLKAAIAARGKATGPLYASAAQDSAPIDNEMIALMQRPSMQAAIAKAQGLAAEKGQAFGISSTGPGGPMNLSGQDLQRVKMALDDMKTTAFTQGIGSHQASAMQDTLDSLKNWMQRNVPSQRAADAAFQVASGPINRMQTLQELQKGSNLTAADVQTGQYFMSPAGFSRGLDAVKEDPFSGVGAGDLTRLEAIRKDLQNSQAINGPALKAPGSDTFQNLAMSQSLGSFGNLVKPLSWLYQKAGVDSGVNEQLANAMLDPQTAVRLMQQSQARTPFNFRPYDIGTLFGAGLPGQTQR